MLAAIAALHADGCGGQGAGRALPAPQIVWARFAGQLVLVCCICDRPLRPCCARATPAASGARGDCNWAPRSLCSSPALKHIGLAEATALADINPVLITLGAALFLGERLGPRPDLAGWLAGDDGRADHHPAGLSASLPPAALLPLAGPCCYAGSALITRRSARGSPLDGDDLHRSDRHALASAGHAALRLDSPSPRPTCRASPPWAAGHGGAALHHPVLHAGRGVGGGPLFLSGDLMATAGESFFGEVPDGCDDSRRACDRAGRALCLARGRHKGEPQARPQDEWRPAGPVAADRGLRGLIGGC
jgi:hypothetical protein